MALNFLGGNTQKKGEQGGGVSTKVTHPEKKSEVLGDSKTEGKKPSKKITPGFLKKGAAAKQALDLEKKKKEQIESGLRRFWIPNDTDTQITFLDGNLDNEGLLDAWYWLEHNVQLNGKYGNFYACTREEEPCPICTTNNPSLVAGLSIIDHTAFESKKTGKMVQDRVLLFVCKATTYQLLQKLAAKRGGLAGCTFDVSRTGEMSPGVGSMFDFVEKNPVQNILQKYSTKDNVLQVPDLQDIITKQYRTADELRALGFGGAVVGKKPVGAEEDDEIDVDYTDLM